MTEDIIDLVKLPNDQLAPLLQGEEKRLTDMFPCSGGDALRAKLRGPFAVNVPNLIAKFTHSGDPALGDNAEPMDPDCKIFADPDDASAVIIVNPTSTVVGAMLTATWESVHIVKSSDYRQ